MILIDGVVLIPWFDKVSGHPDRGLEIFFGGPGTSGNSFVSLCIYMADGQKVNDDYDFFLYFGQDWAECKRMRVERVNK